MGLRLREVAGTRVENKDGSTTFVPQLDEQGNEIELWSVDVPQEIEAKGGAAIDAYVAQQRAASTPPAPAEGSES
jgi:hypothetical protein